MAIVQSRSRRKASGGRNTSTLTKRKNMIGRLPTLTRIEEETKVKTVRTKGGQSKTKLLHTETANLFDPKTKKSSVVEIEGVEENPANRHFVRRNILTKGTIIQTSKGKARVTSRPGQDAVVNALLLNE